MSGARAEGDGGRGAAAAASRRAFDARVEGALDDAALQRVLRDGQDYVQALAAPARAEPAWDAALDEIARVRAETLAHLDRYVAQFADNVERAGGHVFFAADAAEAREHVVGLARERGVRRIVKSKSMVTEEIGLNPALEAAGAEVVETDLGEYIVQLSGERPFHILKPAIHLSVERIRALFSAAAGRDVGADAALADALRPRRAARQVPGRRHGHHRRQLRGRRERLDRARDERGQRPHDDHPAAHARGGHGRRAAGADAARPRGHPRACCRAPAWACARPPT